MCNLERLSKGQSHRKPRSPHGYTSKLQTFLRPRRATLDGGPLPSNLDRPAPSLTSWVGLAWIILDLRGAERRFDVERALVGLVQLHPRRFERR